MGLNLDMNETDYKSLSITELVKQISPSSPVIEELTKRGVIRNRNYTGNIGEYFAIDFFNNFNSEIYTKTKDLPKLLVNFSISFKVSSPLNVLGLSKSMKQKEHLALHLFVKK